jgi:hypothetical protein
MITRLLGVEQHPDVDVDMVRAYLPISQLEYVGEGKFHHRPIMSSVGDLSFASGCFMGTPALEQRMLAGSNSGKKGRHRGTDGLRPHCLGGITEPKSRVRGQQLNKTGGISRINGREQSVPPKRIGDVLCNTAANRRRMLLDHSFSIRASRATSLRITGHFHASCSRPA